MIFFSTRLAAESGQFKFFASLRGNSPRLCFADLSATLAREAKVPLQLAIDHGTRTVVATGSGILRVEDIQGYFYGLTPATLSYGKLLNLSHCSLDLTAQELVALAQEFNALGLSERLGPTAVVVRSEATYRQVSDFKAMTANDASAPDV